MPNAYWIVCYRSVSNPAAVAEYAKIAGPALEAAGGRSLVRGLPAKTHEEGISQRTVIVEFDTVAQAIGAYESDAYKAALRALGNGAERDMRIVEGVS